MLRRKGKRVGEMAHAHARTGSYLFRVRELYRISRYVATSLHFTVFVNES